MVESTARDRMWAPSHCLFKKRYDSLLLPKHTVYFVEQYNEIYSIWTTNQDWKTRWRIILVTPLQKMNEKIVLYQYLKGTEGME